MAKFLDPVIGEFADNGVNFRLTKPFRYITDIDPASFGYSGDSLEIDPSTGLRRLIIIPEGFVTDFATTPQFLWSIAPAMGKHSKGSIIHDWLYVTHKEGRPWADRVFQEACELNGSSWFIKKVYPLTVRVLGRRAWDSYNK